MSRTFADIMERLKRQPEISVLEILEITSEDLVDRFQDFIEIKLEDLQYELEDEDKEDEEFVDWDE